MDSSKTPPTSPEGWSVYTPPLLRRAALFLEDGEWDRADELCEQVLNQDPENAEAYLYKLMAKRHVQQRGDLADCERPFDNDPNFQKAVRFGDEALQAELNGYIALIRERSYENAVRAMNEANTAAAFRKAADAFQTMSGFKDADALVEKCLEQAEFCRKNTVYTSAVRAMNEANTAVAFRKAANAFQTIPGFKDADTLAEQCLAKAQIKAQKRNKTILIALWCGIACLAAVFLVLWFATPAWTLHYEKNETGYTVTCQKRFVKTVEIPATHNGKPVTSIGSFAFYNRTNLTSITIPDSVTGIGDYAFEGCTNLQYNTFANVQYLGNAQNPYTVLVKANDTSITSCTIHADTKVICDSAFDGCTRLMSITIPDSVTSIGRDAFEGCTGLTSITIGNGVTSIKINTFRDCKSLTNVTIGNGVKSIDDYAFYGCTGLTSITYRGTKAQWNAISKGPGWNSNTGNYVVHCTDGDISK